MIVTPCPHGLDDLLGKSTLPRTPGLHVSDIYGDLYRRLEPKRYTDGPMDMLRIEAGLSFETKVEQHLADGLEQGMHDRLFGQRPGEVMSPEGILMSPDLMLFNGSTRVGELKLTWMSTRDMPTETVNGMPPKLDRWLCQLKSYCHILEVPDAMLIGYFVNGSGRPPAPKLLGWEIQFTARELRDNWSMLIRHAESMGVL